MKVVRKHTRYHEVPESSRVGRKIFIIHKWFVWANSGIESVGYGGIVPYSFDAVVKRVKLTAVPALTLGGLVELVKKELAETFAGFDAVLKSGRVNPENLPPPHDIFLESFIAGYENMSPRVYLVRLDIDWPTLHLLVHF